MLCILSSLFTSELHRAKLKLDLFSIISMCHAVNNHWKQVQVLASFLTRLSWIYITLQVTSLVFSPFAFIFNAMSIEG